MFGEITQPLLPPTTSTVTIRPFAVVAPYVIVTSGCVSFLPVPTSITLELRLSNSSIACAVATNSLPVAPLTNPLSVTNPFASEIPVFIGSAIKSKNSPLTPSCVP